MGAGAWPDCPKEVVEIPIDPNPVVGGLPMVDDGVPALPKGVDEGAELPKGVVFDAGMAAFPKGVEAETGAPNGEDCDALPNGVGAGPGALPKGVAWPKAGGLVAAAVDGAPKAVGPGGWLLFPNAEVEPPVDAGAAAVLVEDCSGFATLYFAASFANMSASRPLYFSRFFGTSPTLSGLCC